MQRHTQILVGLNEVQLDLGLKGEQEACEKIRAIKQQVNAMANTGGTTATMIVDGYRRSALDQMDTVRTIIARTESGGPVGDTELMLLRLAAEQLAVCIERYMAMRSPSMAASGHEFNTAGV